MASTIDVLVNLQATRNGRPGRVFYLVVHVEAATRRLKFNHATPAEMYELLILNLTSKNRIVLREVFWSTRNNKICFESRKWLLALYYRYFRNWIKISIWENHSKGWSLRWRHLAAVDFITNPAFVAWLVPHFYRDSDEILFQKQQPCNAQTSRLLKDVEWMN